MQAEGRGKHWFLRAVLGLLILFLCWSAVEASMVRLEITEVTLPDLPEAFDGLRVVFLSDLHIGALSPVSKAEDLAAQLRTLKPDLILLGGDYADFDPFLQMRSSREEALIAQAERRDQFFASLAGIETTLGIYAVAGERDNQLDSRSGVSLEQAARLGGVTVLRDDAVELTRNGQKLVIAGVDDWKTGSQDVRALPEALSSRDCVVLISHNPDALPPLSTREGADGGAWIDLALTGHLLGGRMTLFGHSALYNPSIYQDRFLAGWYREGDAPMLISRGVGTPILPLRFFCPPQIHLITLRRGA